MWALAVATRRGLWLAGDSDLTALGEDRGEVRSRPGFAGAGAGVATRQNVERATRRPGFAGVGAGVATRQNIERATRRPGFAGVGAGVAIRQNIERATRHSHVA
jgi:hypothetical protein